MPLIKPKNVLGPAPSLELEQARREVDRVFDEYMRYIREELRALRRSVGNDARLKLDDIVNNAIGYKM